MHTDELIRLLATGLEPVPAGLPRRRFALALGASLPVSVALMLTFLGLLPTLAETARLPMFWVKLGLPLVLCGAGFLGAYRLSRPGVALGRVGLVAGGALAGIWMLAALVLANAAPVERPHLLLGETWTECPFWIGLLSAPTFVAAFWALRGLAPTRLARAGAAAGLLAGAVGAAVYTLHCPELAAPFIGTWYVLGMLIPAGIGALLGPRLLRW